MSNDKPTIIVNPGTEPIADTEEANAREAVDRFCEDAKARGYDVRWDGAFGVPDDGYYPTTIHVDGRPVEIEMPGCDPDITQAGTPWVSPRMYVDGSSWLWQFALNVLGRDDDADED